MAHTQKQSPMLKARLREIAPAAREPEAAIMRDHAT